MTRWRGNPGPVAARMVDRVLSGELRTRGEWADFSNTLITFPPALQQWVCDQIIPVIGQEGTEYLLSFASTPRPKYAMGQGVVVNGR